MSKLIITVGSLLFCSATLAVNIIDGVPTHAIEAPDGTVAF